MRLLVVEDDPVVGQDLTKALTDAGFVVDLSTDGEDAWFQGDVEDYVLAVLDLGLPRLDGLSVLRKWRSASRTFPVLILSARSDWTEKVEGIQSGADDYLAKPFAMGELVARVRSLVRRAAGHAAPSIVIGRVALDTAHMIASVDGKPLKLTLLEYRLLDLLAHRPGQFVTATEIAEHLHGANNAGDTNSVEALVLRLRRKIGPGIVESQRNFGYTLASA